MATLHELLDIRRRAAAVAWNKIVSVVESMHMDEIVASVDLKFTSEVGYESLFNTRADFVQLIAAFEHLSDIHFNYVDELERLVRLTDFQIPIMSVKAWIESYRERLNRLIRKYHSAAWNRVVPALDFLEEEVNDALVKYEQATGLWCPERELLDRKWGELERAVVRLCPIFSFNHPKDLIVIYSRYNRLVERYNDLLERCYEEKAALVQTAAEGPQVQDQTCGAGGGGGAEPENPYVATYAKPGGEEAPGQSTVQSTDGRGAMKEHPETTAVRDGGHCLPGAVDLPVDQPGQVESEESPGEEAASRVPTVAEGAVPGEMTTKPEILAAIVIIPPECLPEGRRSSGGEAVQETATTGAETARVYPAGEGLVISIPVREEVTTGESTKAERPAVPALVVTAADPREDSAPVFDAVADLGVVSLIIATPGVQTGAILITESTSEQEAAAGCISTPEVQSIISADGVEPEAEGGMETPASELHSTPSGLSPGENGGKVLPHHASLCTSPRQSEEASRVPVRMGGGTHSGGTVTGLCSNLSGQSPGGLHSSIPDTQPGLQCGLVEKGLAPQNGEPRNDLSWAEIVELEHQCCDCCESQPLFDNPFSVASRSVKRRFAKWKGKKKKSFPSSAERAKRSHSELLQPPYQ